MKYISRNLNLVEQKQSYLQELHSVATPNKEIINTLRDLMTEIRKDQSLSEELHNFYDFYYSLEIFAHEVLYPFYRTAWKIWVNYDYPIGNLLPLDTPNQEDMYDETFKKLETFSPKRRKNYIDKYFSRDYRNKINKSIRENNLNI